MTIAAEDTLFLRMRDAAASRRLDNSRLSRRRAAELRFRIYGLLAIGTALAFLIVLLTSIITSGWTAFFQTSVRLPISFDAQEVDPEGKRSPDALAQANYQKLAYTALYKV